jgi:LacI family transcriptional regulator
MTIRKIAKLAGTSYSTVSRALNNSPLVAEDTKRRIAQLADELGYQINASARGLATGIKTIIGIVYPFHSLRPHESVYTNQAIDLIRKELNVYHFDTLIAGYDRDTQTDGDDITRLVRQKKVDGLVIFGQEISPGQIRALRDTGFPFLLVNPPPLREVRSCHRICIDHRHGGFLAGTRLIETGRRRLLCLTEDSVQFRVRTDGFVSAVESSAQPIQFKKMLLENGLYETAYEFIHANIQSIREFDGIFVQSDISSIGVLNCLRDHQVSVPDEVAIVGFDDIQWAQYARPSLTTVHQPKDEVAAIATEIIMELITGGAGTPIRKQLKPVLVIRESC